MVESKGQSLGNSIQEILRTAPSEMISDFIVLRGPLLRGRTDEEFVVQLDPTSHRHWGVFNTQDVLGDPHRVPDEELTSTERGLTVYEVRIRRGCRATYVRESPYHVGVDPVPKDTEHQMIGAQQVGLYETTTRSIAQILQSAGSCVEPDYTLFHGAIFKGFNDREFILQPNLANPYEWGIVNLEDLVEPDAVEVVPRELLRVALRGQNFYLVKIRNGAVIRTVWAKQRVVDPLTSTRAEQISPGGCGCSSGESTASNVPRIGEALTRPGPGPGVANQGNCAVRVGACPPQIGGSGYPCATPGAACIAGAWPFTCTSTCMTFASCFWGCVCDCC